VKKPTSGAEKAPLFCCLVSLAVLDGCGLPKLSYLFSFWLPLSLVLLGITAHDLFRLKRSARGSAGRKLAVARILVDVFIIGGLFFLAFERM
jgi:hypothetical protein